MLSLASELASDLLVALQGVCLRHSILLADQKLLEATQSNSPLLDPLSVNAFLSIPQEYLRSNKRVCIHSLSNLLISVKLSLHVSPSRISQNLHHLHGRQPLADKVNSFPIKSFRLVKGGESEFSDILRVD